MLQSVFAENAKSGKEKSSTLTIKTNYSSKPAFPAILISSAELLKLSFL
jgi:hypothetical protein